MLQPAVPEQQRDGRRGEHFDDGKEEGVEGDRAQLRVAMRAVDRIEGRPDRRLAMEELHHAHAGEILLQVAVHPGDGTANVAERLTHRAPENRDDQPHRRKDRERHQRQAPVDREHHRADREQRGEVADHGHHTRREELVERLNVGGDARHQTAHRLTIEEWDRETLQPLKDLPAQIRHHALPDPRGQHRLRVLGHKGEEQRRQEPEAKSKQEIGVAGRNGHVDGALGEEGAHQGQPGFEQQQRDGPGDAKSIRPHVGQQAAAQPAIASAGGDIIRRHRAHGDSTSMPLRPLRTQPEKTTKPKAMVNHERMQRQTIV